MDSSIRQKLTDYRVPSETVELIRSSQIVFLVGVTAAGKDTIISELLKSGDYHYIVSHTTRAPRHNHGVLERNGFEYHFIDLKQAGEMLDRREFIEAKLVHGNVYGTSVAEIQTAKDKSEIAISEIEVQGIAEYRAVADNVLPIFILPPNFAVWQERLIKRYDGVTDVNDLQRRLETAKNELHDALEKDYFEFVVNNDLNITISIVDEIAHGNLSQAKNEQAKVVARQLLDELKARS